MPSIAEGQRVGGRYVIEGRAGGGGMGTIYRARERATGRAVAIKMIEATDDIDMERFDREAELLARLSHPAIVSYLDHGRDDSGASWLAMAWIDGESLRSVLRGTGLERRNAVAIAADTADALGHAHARGVIHRDVKPDNLMLTGGRIIVVDFGVARAIAPGMSLTVSGSIVGTPGYMSPEQARGERELDGRSDIFSLGCVLYECLAGRPAFASQNMSATLVKILLAEPPPVHRLPPRLAAVLSAMLAKEATHRPASMELVAAELRSALPDVGDGHIVTPVRATETVRGPACLLLAMPGPFRRASAGERARRAVGAIDPDLEVDVLSDGSFVVNVVVRGGPAAQAEIAARCALALRAAEPDYFIAIACGTAAGDLIDRAARLIASAVIGAEVALSDDSPQIAIDPATAALLGDDFEIAPGGSQLVLRGHRTGAEPG